MSNRVTNIQVVPIRPTNGLVGIASFVYDESFYMGSIGIVTRPEGGYRLSYPTRPAPAVGMRGFRIHHPIHSSISDEIEKLIVDKFEKIQTFHRKEFDQ